MNNTEYKEATKELFNRAHEIEEAKRPAYVTGHDDVLTNFKDTADSLDLQPLQVWAVLFKKHVDAIYSYAQCKDIPQAEDIAGRFADAINYLKLGYALMIEKENSPSHVK